MTLEGWEGFAEFCNGLASRQKVGRASLRREWGALRALAATVLPEIPDQVVEELLGKRKLSVDPEENDLKAVVSYAVGRGMIEPEQVRLALEADNRHSPLFWLAGLSGKAFGENIAPQLCAYWLVRAGDLWEKQSGSAYFDITWTPRDRGEIRMELKASSENPGFRFQQIRDPRFTGVDGHDYDLLLCLGVTASTLEFWSIPADDVARLIDDGTLPNQHGGKKMGSNTYWFVADAKTRRKLASFSAEAVNVRATILAQMES